MSSATALPGSEAFPLAAQAPAQEGRAPSRRVAVALILLGLLILYVPVAYEFGSQFLWDQDESHSSFLLALVLWAYWSDRHALRWDATAGERGIGAAIIAVGFVFYFVGRVTNLLQLQGISLPIVATGLTLAIGGRGLVKRWWLLSLLLVFIVPWFGPIADVFLVPLRLGITKLAVKTLHFMGFPVSAEGVLINIGFVRLNIAGACVGLRSMISLTAIGLLFLHFFPPASVRRGLLFVLALPVIALTANFVRICYLILTAALFGASGEAFVHDGAAYAEVVIAVGAFMLLGKALTGKQATS